jgi:hypothetical protein
LSPPCCISTQGTTPVSSKLQVDDCTAKVETTSPSPRRILTSCFPPRPPSRLTSSTAYYTGDRVLYFYDLGKFRRDILFLLSAHNPKLLPLDRVSHARAAADRFSGSDFLRIVIQSSSGTLKAVHFSRQRRFLRQSARRQGAAYTERASTSKQFFRGQQWRGNPIHSR